MHAPPTGPRRFPFLAVPALAALLLAPGTAVAAPAPSGSVASVSRGVCTTSATDMQARAASFTVRMRDVPPTTSYGFSARLEERLQGGPWRALKGDEVPAGFGAFDTARAGAPRMTRRINVQGLHPGSSYRLRVSYRWAGSGAPRAVQRVSSACAVKDLRPDVGLTGEFGWQPSTTGGEVAYRIGLQADGLDALKGIDVPVVVRQGTAVLATGTVRPTSPSDALLLAGRRCTLGQPVVVQLDPEGIVDDRDATDDVLTTSCTPVAR